KILNVEKARFDKMLSSDEIRTLITALGAGIGEGNHDIEKLRYHNIVIMTDADVDGSHIRTLLLTFFYRQMPQMIERGYLYIAQPPLYKVKKGKSEVYLKDDKAMQEYLIDLGVDGAIVETALGKITQGSLSDLVRELILARQLLQRTEKKFDPRVVEAFLKACDIRKETLKNDEELNNELEKLKQYLTLKYPQIGPYTVDIAEDIEHSAKTVFFKTTYRSAFKTTKIDTAFTVMAEIHELKMLEKKFREHGSGPFKVMIDDKETVLNELDDVREHIIAEGKRGLSIQRYKGLGEMNPAQLWETTMNPESRTLLKVQVEDAVECDQIFTVLMGDQVEPRREFIEQNALSVKNLDI
ncbi:MAG: hypothetical protein ACD_73C00192G0004, partial [uncultured bacterium]